MSRESELTGFVKEVHLRVAEEFWLTADEKGVNVYLFNHMRKFSFGKREHLTKRPQFELVMDQGQKYRVENFCTVFFLPNSLDRKRLGIIASKKIGNAVVRNLAKRKIREVFRHIKDRFEPALDIVIVSGRNLVSLPVSVIERKIFQSLPIKR
jgi:ribonuclease P protein component